MSEERTAVNADNPKEKNCSSNSGALKRGSTTESTQGRTWKMQGKIPKKGKHGCKQGRRRADRGETRI